MDGCYSMVDGFMTFSQALLGQQGLLSQEKIGECGKNAMVDEVVGAQHNFEAQKTDEAARLTMEVTSRSGCPEAR